jgi:H+-translocating NAD(P) transhydrogenase subunit alpha
MAPGSVVVDLAAVRGGNCELTKPGETVVHHGVHVLGPLNFPALAPYHSSQMFSSNVTTFLKHLAPLLPLTANPADEIVRDTLVTFGGNIVHQRVCETFGLPAATKAITNGNVK